MQSIHLLQAKYWESKNSFKSAQLLIERKSRNMAYLLKNYLPYRRKQYPDQAEILSILINKIGSKILYIPNTKTRQELMLAEAGISHLYWKGFALLCHCPLGWKRTYPRGQDAWNISLNIGYTMLNKLIAKQLTEDGLSLEIGLLHSPQNGSEALVYDFQELFRQPFVDAAIIPLFSKYKNIKISNGKIVAACADIFEKNIHYNDKSIQPITLIKNEVFKYIHAMDEGTLYTPYINSWSHNKIKKPKHNA